MYKYGLVDSNTGIISIYEIESDLVPEHSLLDIMYKRDIDKETGIVYTNDPNIEYIIWYLRTKPIIRDDLAEHVLTAWGVHDDYDVIWNEERNMRINMYKPEFAEHEMNRTHYFNLVKMDTFRQKQLESSIDYRKPDDLLFNSPYMIVIDYDKTLEYLRRFDFIFIEAKSRDVDVVIAGEYVFRTVVGFDNLVDILPIDAEKGVKESWSEQTSDEMSLTSRYMSGINVFFLSTNVGMISDYLDAIVTELDKPSEDEFDETEKARVRIYRTADFLSITVELMEIRVLKINFCLRVYRTFSEVLHSFDVDSNCIGYDGANVWCTKRCEYALMGGFNTLNFNLLSTPYQDRLCRAGTLGMSVKIPGLDDYVINRDKIQSSYNDKHALIQDKLKSLISQLETMKPYVSESFLHPMNLLEEEYRKLDYRGPTNFKSDRDCDFLYQPYSPEHEGIDRMLELEYVFMSNNRVISSVQDVFDIITGVSMGYLATTKSRKRTTSVKEQADIDKTLRALNKADKHITINPTGEDIIIISRYAKITYPVLDYLHLSDNAFKLLSLLANVQLTQDVRFTYSVGRMINNTETTNTDLGSWFLGDFTEKSTS